MYIFNNGQIVRPPVDAMDDTTVVYKPKGATNRKMRNKRVSKLSKRCRQVLMLLIILFTVYVFTCGKCANVLRLFKLN